MRCDRIRMVALLLTTACAAGPIEDPPPKVSAPPRAMEPPQAERPTRKPLEIGVVPVSASAVQREALYWVNTYRTRAGAAVLDQIDALNASATSHAAYLVRNPSLYTGGLSAHDQVPTGLGFSGEHFWDRMVEAGYDGDPFGEVIAYEARPASAIAHWIETAYHRLPLLSPRSSHLGYAQLADGTDHVNVLDLGRDEAADAAGSAGSGVVLWPPPGENGVSLAWDGAETPPPPAPPAGFPSGPVISAQFAGPSQVEVVASALRSEKGEDVPHVLLSPGNDPNLEGQSAVVLYAHAPLDPDTTYSVHIEVLIDGETVEKSWSFRTVPAAPCDLVAQDCGIGQGCFTAASGSVCAWDGLSGEGDSCGFQNDCSAGLTCAGEICRRYCRLDVGGPDGCELSCPNGVTELAVLGVGVCKGPQPPD